MVLPYADMVAEMSLTMPHRRVHSESDVPLFFISFISHRCHHRINNGGRR